MNTATRQLGNLRADLASWQARAAQLEAEVARLRVRIRHMEDTLCIGDMRRMWPDGTDTMEVSPQRVGDLMADLAALRVLVVSRLVPLYADAAIVGNVGNPACEVVINKTVEYVAALREQHQRAMAALRTLRYDDPPEKTFAAIDAVLDAEQEAT